MSRTSILELVETFALGDADRITTELYYDHFIQELGRAPWMVAASLVSITPGTGQYTLADDQIKLLGVFYDDRWLDRTDKIALESFNPGWRDERGRPVAYMVDDEPSKTYRLYPVPTQASGNFIFLYGSPLGLDYPPYAVLVLHTQALSNLLDIMEMPVLWDVLAREYGHESNHRDDQFADFCQQFSSVLWSLIK